ncbi:hypothetical protein [Hydrogenophaga laconesensis]|uniref:Uncharacterized protein n=1 Tax=Hydrogenophaga laconesensis TaxID=1805971 RepID=A0ABU1VF51_9BURK|nr:hypothetical protein [Hydrogenophaga laconesensis]MDR7096096.1 hypothetical protein [Hydrogenophaga laconesensis]
MKRIRTWLTSAIVLFAGSALSLAHAQPEAQAKPKTVNVFSHFNSLHNHAAKESNSSTRVGNWVARMTAQSQPRNVYTLAAQFGFFTQWTLPPQNHVAHEEVRSPYLDRYSASWKRAGAINVVEFVPDNFDAQGTDPSRNTNMGAAYETVLLRMIDAWEANAPGENRRYVVYAGWPQLGRHGGKNDDPASVSAEGYKQWVAYGLGDYQRWMELLVSRLKAARPALDIRLHNINKAVLVAYRDTAVGTIPPNVLFTDLAPHGRASWYFLAGVAEYIELFGEKPPANFKFDSAWAVAPTIVENYQQVVDAIWSAVKP